MHWLSTGEAKCVLKALWIPKGDWNNPRPCYIFIFNWISDPVKMCSNLDFSLQIDMVLEGIFFSCIYRHHYLKTIFSALNLHGHLNSIWMGFTSLRPLKCSNLWGKTSLKSIQSIVEYQCGRKFCWVSCRFMPVLSRIFTLYNSSIYSKSKLMYKSIVKLIVYVLMILFLLEGSEELPVTKIFLWVVWL